MHFTSIYTLIKDILFPAYCLGCKKEGSFVCDTCFQTLDCSGVFCCPECHKDTHNGSYCATCTSLHLDRHIAITPYKDDKLIGSLLHQFKYSYVEDIQTSIAHMVDIFCNRYDITGDVVVPVPLHRRRYVERGFNQAEVIARVLARRVNIPMHDMLTRTRYTKQQAKLNRDGRLKNLKHAFALKEGINVKGKRIILVDDVFTTGSTLQECAMVLKDAGAEEVVGFSVARG